MPTGNLWGFLGILWEFYESFVTIGAFVTDVVIVVS